MARVPVCSCFMQLAAVVHDEVKFFKNQVNETTTLNTKSVEIHGEGARTTTNSESSQRGENPNDRPNANVKHNRQQQKFAK